MTGFLGKLWNILGITLSASSIVSLIQMGFDIPLALSPEAILNFYRELIQPIFQLLYKPLTWLFNDLTVPNWLMDAQTLSLVISGIYIRAKSVQRVDGEQIHYQSMLSKIVSIGLLGFTLFGLLFLPFVLISMIMLPVYYVNQLRWNKHLKWYQFQNVLKSVYSASGNAGALFNTSAIYAYLSLFIVVLFYLWNSIIP
ncbi:hypothetical protein M3P19_02340 [Muricauda sp. 2012CJ35-5]|uniref:Uncharacterized protein n=1 Tax=Flagellimonas spongiicola TaxID=2942208 RepID=A0ABT0PNL8_9FLAO|nr:hypothetical protein [Allomuricauda spongiicola]MCL6272826.1 hypothetical protein [Allomuricauda spongiicola]